MEKALTKLSSFTIPRKAKQELSAIGGDISVSAASPALWCHSSFAFLPLFFPVLWGLEFLLVLDESIGLLKMSFLWFEIACF